MLNKHQNGKAYLDSVCTRYGIQKHVARIETTCFCMLQLKLKCMLQRDQKETEIWSVVYGLNSVKQQIAIDHVPGCHCRSRGIISDIPQENVPIYLIVGIPIRRDVL